HVSQTDTPSAPCREWRKFDGNSNPRGRASGIAYPEPLATQSRDKATHASARNERHVSLRDVVVIGHEPPILDVFTSGEVVDVARVAGRRHDHQHAVVAPGVRHRRPLEWADDLLFGV